MKKCWKQVVMFVLVAVAALWIGRTDAKAATIVEKGSCGDGATYTLDSDGLLTISGSGEIAESAFDGEPYTDSYYLYASKIKKLVIGNGITVISEKAFQSCRYLSSIIIPESVTEIGNSAFDDCRSLASVTIPTSVTKIGSSAFAGCEELKSITIPKSVMEIGDWAFSNCDSLVSIIIQEGVKKIGQCAFFDCSSLTSITIPDSVTSIEDWAFAYCSSLASITIPDSVTSIGDYAFGYNGYDESWNPIKMKNFIIYGTKGSAAETYAKENGFTFKTNGGTTELTSKNTIVKLSKTSFNFDGKAKTPTVKVLDTKGRTLKKSNYTVTYSNNVKVGKATATITFKGKYSGTIKKTFTIKPAKTTITGTSRKSDSVTLTWKKQKKEVSGYQIQYATDRKFTKNAKTVTSKGIKKSSKKISGLSKKTTYYFRIRTYKTVNGKKYYSGWSKIETVKTK